MNIISVTNTHGFLLLQIFGGGDFQVGVIARSQCDRQPRQFKQAAIIGDKRRRRGIHGSQCLPVQCGAKALGRLHGKQRAALRRGNHAAVLGDFNGVLHRNGGCGGTAFGGCLQGVGDQGIAHKGAGGIVDSYQLAVGSSQTVFNAVSAGRTPLHHGAGLGAGIGDRLTVGKILPCHQHQFGNGIVGGKGGAACLQNGAAAGQPEAELVKPHTARSPRCHDNSGDGRKYRSGHRVHYPLLLMFT